MTISVLVVDDSAFARKVIREVLSRDPDISVVGFARDGLEALEAIAYLKPDVVTLDLVMPNLDGLGVLRELPALGSSARVVAVSISDEASEIVVEALSLGAVALVRKPTAQATGRLYELSDELRRAVHEAAEAKAPSSTPHPVVVPLPPRAPSSVQVVVIGVSTGGPQALTKLLAAMPAHLPVPVLIALHIPADYTGAMAKRLDALSPLDVVEASDGLAIRPGLVVLAKGGIHLQLEGNPPRLRLNPEPRTSLYFPSVDLLFASAAATLGSKVLGVVLTGMGDDGVEGARAIVAAGGRVLTESASSCVVYGMPMRVKESGYSVGDAPIEEMAAAIAREVGAT